MSSDSTQNAQEKGAFHAASTTAGRFLLILLALVALGLVVSRLRLVVLPVFVAVLLTAVLRIPLNWLRSVGLPKLLATWLVFLVGAATVAGLGVWIIPRFVSQLGGIGNSVDESITKAETWLHDGPLDLSTAQVQNAVDSFQQALRDRSDQLASGAFATASLGKGKSLC